MNFIKTLHKQWWFWILIIPIVAWGAWYGYLWYSDWVYQAPYRAQERELQAGLKAWEVEGNRIAKLYKKDAYGGDTPEETLELFIEALEAEDYELASKYYLPEQQEGSVQELKTAKFLEQYINILKNYKNTGEFYDEGKKYEINYYKNSTQIHFERLLLNKYTEKWKIENR